MKIKLSNVGVAAVRLLEALSASADAFPLLKSAAGGALHFAKLDYHSNSKAWARFAERVQESVARIAQSIADQRFDGQRLHKSLDELNSALVRMRIDIEQKHPSGTLKRAIAFIFDPRQIDDMEKDFARAMELFHLDSSIQIGQDISQILQGICKSVDQLPTIIQGLQQVETSLQTSMHISTLTKLPYAQGATWNPDQMCYPGTRGSILDEIMLWAADSEGDTYQQVFCLTAAPGAGKTAIAHSVSKLCADKGWLATAFFFNREDSTRAPMVFSTIACDLAARFSSFRSSISHAIEQDPSLVSAGLTRQFNGLIAPFASRFSQEKPIIIVLDALDEGFTKEILNILLQDICSLPKVVHFFMTTRDTEDIRLLLGAPHVRHRRFIHHEGLDLEDVKLVAQANLKDIALVKGWPTEKVVQLVVERSEGLMIWVVAVCQYLKEVLDPQGDLQNLLEKKLPSDQGAEEKMDELYATILLRLPWRDRKFVIAYKQVMGTILTSKVPLSAHAIDSLHSGIVQLPNLLEALKPLLLPSDEGQPIQVLHQSLHDLLTKRASVNKKWRQFSVNEGLHNQRLTGLCLQVINKELSESTPGTGYLDGDQVGIPKVPDQSISEHLKYACRFWMEHLLLDNKLSQQIVDALHTFLDDKFSLWLELTACIGLVKGIDPLITCIDESWPRFRQNVHSHRVAKTWISITKNLSFENRRHEALIAAEQGLNLTPIIQNGDLVIKNQYANALKALSIAQSGMGKRHEAVENARACKAIFDELVENNSDAFKPDLAGSLCNFSMRLSEMGLREDALKTSRDAMDLYKQLAKKNPNSFNQELAMSLNTLSSLLSEMGLREESLQAIRDSVDICKQLAGNNPVTFNPVLAHSLNSLSSRLSEMGMRGDALQAIRNAVDIRRQLAEQHPNAFNPALAGSLRNLSILLSDMGLREDALQASRDAMDMYNQLAEKNPDAFDSDLAMSLNTLSNSLLDMGFTEEALQAIREAVDICKQLVEQNPVVFNPDLASFLNNLSSRLSDMGLREDALQAITDAVNTQKQLAEQNSVAFNHDLAGSLNNLSLRLSEMGLREDALQTIRDAVDIRKQLAEENPNAFNPVLASSLQNLSIMLSDMGMREDALQASRDAMHMYKQLAEQNPNAFNPVLAGSLQNLSIMLSDMGLREDALQASRDAVDMYKQLAEKTPNAFDSDLAMSLNTLSNSLSDMGFTEEALHAIRDAVDICNQLHQETGLWLHPTTNLYSAHRCS